MTSEIRTNSLKSRAGLSTVTMTDSGPMFSGITTFVDNSGFNLGTGSSIFTPASNTLTFGTNSNERLRITSDGRIGINDSTPNDYELDIMKRSTATDAQIRLHNNGSASNNDTVMRYSIAGTSASNYIYFGDGDDSNVGQIRYQHSNDSMQFFASASERLRITSEGQVKLTGTNSGNHMSTFGTNVGGLTIDDVGNQHTGLEVSHGSNKVFLVASSNNSVYLSSYGTGNFILEHTGGSGTRERIRVNNAGAIGLSGANYGTAGQVLTSAGSGSVPTWTTVSGTTINNNANDRVITGSGTANTLEAEANLTFETATTGGTLTVAGTSEYQLRLKDSNSSGNGAETALAFTDSGNTIQGFVGYNYWGDGNLDIQNNNSGGSVCINTGGGNERLIVASDGTTTASGTSDGVLQLTTTDSRGAFIRFGQGGSYHNMVGCADGLTSGDKEDLGIRAADNIIFAAGGSTERLRISSSGKLLVGTSSATSLGSHTGASNVSTFNQSGITLTQYGVTAGFYYDRLNFTNSQYFIVNASNTGVYLGNGSTSWTAYSDERLKTNITELDGTKAYNHIKTARATSFKWNATGYPTDTKIGFIAQDWETNYPEVVNTTTETIDSVENPKGIQYTETVPVLMAALKQAITKIETLEQENIALRVRVTNLEGN